MWTVEAPVATRRPAMTVQRGIDPRLAGVTLQRTRPDFQLTRVLAPDGANICSIRVTGRMIQQDRYGVAVRYAFDTTQRELAATYGPATQVVDALRNDAYYADAEEWLEAIFRNERTYAAAWQPDKPLADNISGITLTVRAVSKDAAYITVQYRFDSHPRC